MAEYIKIDKNTFPTPYKINVGNYAQGWNACLNSVLQHKTADVVEVVRCKDCIHKVATEDGEYNPDDIVCDYHMSDGFCENDFCSYGERKEDEE